MPDHAPIHLKTQRILLAALLCMLGLLLHPFSFADFAGMVQVLTAPDAAPRGFWPGLICIAAGLMVLIPRKR